MKKLTDEQLARKFHKVYERLAPSFGYETRKETRQFDPGIPNGKLMIAVCGELLNDLTAESAEQREQGQAAAWPQYKIVVDALSNLLGQVEKFCIEHGEADFSTGEALRAMESVCEYEAKATPPAGVPDGLSKLDAEYWLQNRAKIIDAIGKAGFRLMSNKDHFWLSAAPQPEDIPAIFKEQAS